VVITDLGVLEPDPQSHELTVVATHPGVDSDRLLQSTGWGLRVAKGVAVSEPPTPGELEVLRGLLARTREAHAR
jgi:glutaconate CoA-transferase subunit B